MVFWHASRSKGITWDPARERHVNIYQGPMNVHGDPQAVTLIQLPFYITLSIIKNFVFDSIEIGISGFYKC